MRRILFGTVFILHGLAHANAGMLAADRWRIVPTVLWGTASPALIAAGFALIGVRRFDRRWRMVGLTGIAASVLLLLAYRLTTALPGMAVDIVILGIMASISMPRLDPTSRPRGRWRSVGAGLAYAFLAYVGVVDPNAALAFALGLESCRASGGAAG